MPFLGAAFAQGGGAGIFGDLLFAEQNRFGKGIVMTTLGPVASLVDDSTRLTLGNLQQFLQGEESNFMKEPVNYLHRYQPGGNSWYARLALERMLWDSLRRMADPDAEQSFRRIMQRARQDYGSEFWWKPGEALPQRAPISPE